MENKLLDYHEFYGESSLYIPARVSYEWIDENPGIAAYPLSFHSFTHSANAMPAPP